MSIKTKLHKEGYCTVAEAAEMSGLSKATVYRWAQQGDVDVRDVASKIWINVASFEARLGLTLEVPKHIKVAR